MAAAFSPLGVEISFEEPGFAVVANTKKRTTKAVTELLRLAGAQAHPNSERLQILGISHFMEPQTQGRCGAQLMNRIRQEMRDPANIRRNLPPLLRALQEHSLAAQPRRVKLFGKSRPVILLTDEAAEVAEAAIGGVVLDWTSGAFRFCGGVVAPQRVDWLRTCGQGLRPPRMGARVQRPSGRTLPPST